MKKLLTLIVMAALIIGAWFYWSPRAAARDLRNAASSGDVEELQRLVDFPLVQEQLKADLKASLLGSIDTTRSTGGGALAAGLSSMMIDGLVNQVVSPSGIAAIVRSGRVNGAGTARVDGEDPVMRLHYEGLNAVVVTARNPHSPPADTVSFVLRRRWLSWQLVRIMIPRLDEIR